jgi:F-type H+-transporting ATPase subunit delta
VSDAKIARVYAEALFAAASEVGRVDAVRRDLTEFTDALRSIPSLRRLLEDEAVKEETKREILLRVTEGGDPLLQNFLRLLVDKGREAVVEDALSIYSDLVDAAGGVVEVEITTARPLPAEMVAEISASVGASLQKTVDLKLTVDEEVLGGVKLRIGDKIADASLRHRLEQLRARLVSPMARLEGSVEAAS